MSIPVVLDELRDRAGGQAPYAYLVTVGVDGAPHVVAVTPVVDAHEITCAAGATTRANVAAHGRATLVWPPRDAGTYTLLADGDAVALEPDAVVVRPTRAVLHRPAGCEEVSLPPVTG
jgi:hypothetical protein